MVMDAETKKRIIVDWAGSEDKSGSIEAQIGLITHRVRIISSHLENNHKDHSSRRGLLKLLGRRKRLIRYLSRKDEQKAKILREKMKS